MTVTMDTFKCILTFLETLLCVDNIFPIIIHWIVFLKIDMLNSYIPMWLHLEKDFWEVSKVKKGHKEGALFQRKLVSWDRKMPSQSPPCWYPDFRFPISRTLPTSTKHHKIKLYVPYRTNLKTHISFVGIYMNEVI